MAKILIVDDDTLLNEMLRTHLERTGHQATSALTLSQGIEMAQQGNFDLIFLDVQLPDGNSLDAFNQFAEVTSVPEIIIMTGNGDPHGAKKAIQFGAWGYLEKPHVVRDLLLPVTRALQYREEKRKIGIIPVVLKREAIVGSSQPLMNCLDVVAKAATTDASVLITGETGTGKEIFARAIHDNSPRAEKAFVVVDCASLPESLIESTLFGHVKGAFTGAERTTGGLIKMAHGGTLFLDEVGEMPLKTQKSFLRVLQERKYRPVGETKEEYSNFRLIAATNRNLELEIGEGRFRSDLLFRLRSLSLHLPPLRERKEDIRALTQFFINRLCSLQKITNKGIDEELFEYLTSYDWPGNVRELQQTIEQVFTNAVRHPTLFAYHLPESFRIQKALCGIKSTSNKNENNSKDVEINSPLPWKDYKILTESQYLKILLELTNGNIKESCKISGLSRSRLYQLISNYKINIED